MLCLTIQIKRSIDFLFLVSMEQLRTALTTTISTQGSVDAVLIRKVDAFLGGG